MKANNYSRCAMSANSRVPLFLIISLISISLISRCCHSTSTRRSTTPPPSLSNQPLMLPPFNEDVAEMIPEDLENLHKMVQNTLDFYQATLSPLESRARFNWSAVENSLKKGRNFCKAAFLLAKGIIIAPKYPIEEDWFEMVAAVGTRISTRANELIAANSYTRQSVNKPQLKLRAEKMLNDIHRLILVSPYGLYLQWDKLSDLQNPLDPNTRLDMIENIADIIGQLRAVDIVHDMKTIQGVFNQVRKENKKLLKQRRDSAQSTSGAASDTSDDEQTETDPEAQCSSATD